MEHNRSFIHIPAVAVCGWSGSGKTWLLEKLIQRYSRQGFSVGVIKHDAHRLELDRPGKNTFRLWEAGAQSLLAHDETQLFMRRRKPGTRSLEEWLAQMSRECDFVLVEGHKTNQLPKLWLDHPDKPGKPNEIDNVIAHLSWGDNRLDDAEKIIKQQLHDQWQKRPINAGILTGGKSRRMGYPKHKLEVQGKSVLETLTQAVSPFVDEVVLIGNNRDFSDSFGCMQLPDIPYCDGPLAGILSAFRWNPNSSWLIVACDMPNVQQQTVEWLLSKRKFGKWGTIPLDERYCHPLFAIYEPASFSLFEQSCQSGQFSITKIVQNYKISQIKIPSQLNGHILNCNSPEDLKRVTKAME